MRLRLQSYSLLAKRKQDYNKRCKGDLFWNTMLSRRYFLNGKGIVVETGPQYRNH